MELVLHCDQHLADISGFLDEAGEWRGRENKSDDFTSVQGNSMTLVKSRIYKIIQL
jgi:hypothetical protein